jgi:hypothetical protein
MRLKHTPWHRQPSVNHCLQVDAKHAFHNFEVFLIFFHFLFLKLQVTVVCCIRHIFLFLNTDFVGSINTRNICLILSTIYNFISVSVCIDMGLSALLWPGPILWECKHWTITSTSTRVVLTIIKPKGGSRRRCL